jgi:hypothetical protein
MLAAGMAAEYLLGGRETSSQRTVAHGGSLDLRDIQTGCRYAWQCTQDGKELSPPIDPSWTVADIAGHVWRRAVELVWARGNVVSEVAAALVRSPRALSQAQIRRIVEEASARCEANTAGRGVTLVRQSPPASEVEFWPAQYSRLAWRPKKVQAECRAKAAKTVGTAWCSERS